GLDRGNAGQIRWKVVGGEGLDVHLDEADKRATVIGPLAATAIDDDPDTGDQAAVDADDIDGLLDASATRDHVFRHDEPFVRPDLKTTPQHETAGVFLGEDVAFPEGPADFLADDDAAQSRRDDGIALEVAQFIGEPSA